MGADLVGGIVLLALFGLCLTVPWWKPRCPGWLLDLFFGPDPPGPPPGG